MEQTAKELILAEIIDIASRFNSGIATPIPEGTTATEYHDMLMDAGFEDDLYDATSEFRGSGEDTGIEAPYSRYYESTQVARVLPSGVVSWTYWYGGGKHSEPDAIDWIDAAFLATVEQKTTVVNIYAKA